MRREPTDKDKIDLFTAWWGEYERTRRQNESLSEALEGLMGYTDDLRRIAEDSPVGQSIREISPLPVLKARALLAKNFNRKEES